MFPYGAKASYKSTFHSESLNFPNMSTSQISSTNEINPMDNFHFFPIVHDKRSLAQIPIIQSNPMTNLIVEPSLHHSTSTSPSQMSKSNNIDYAHNNVLTNPNTFTTNDSTS